MFEEVLLNMLFCLLNLNPSTLVDKWACIKYGQIKSRLPFICTNEYQFVLIEETALKVSYSSYFC